ncbi:MAG: sugar transferase, partial [Candidatus Niyogibacteria bacterium]|nr:sugar transferase [Candidatus Niyogibacteria bacterium]
RPERPEIVKHLETMISHYDMRHLIKPGVTGWAQINMPQVYAGTVEETLEKLQYDLYYIKYQSVIIDIAIILKTILLTLTRRGR